MKKNNKKGFTLVELLVVIAILAILATVSVVGYTSFTQKAKDSNAQTELVQARDIIRADLLTTEGTTYRSSDEEIVFTKETTGYTVAFTKGSTEGAHDDFNACLKVEFTDLKDLGTFTLTDSKTITYTSNGGTAIWNLEADTVTAGTK